MIKQLLTIGATAIGIAVASTANAYDWHKNGWFIKTALPYPTTITIKSGATVPFDALPAPWNTAFPTNQGPGRFGFEYIYSDKVYGNAFQTVDEQGNATFAFNFSNSTRNPLRSCAAAVFNTKEGKAVFGVATMVGVDGYSTLNRSIPIGNKTHTKLKAVNFTQPPEWWNEVDSITIYFVPCVTVPGENPGSNDPKLWLASIAQTIEDENLMVF